MLSETSQIDSSHMHQDYSQLKVDLEALSLEVSTLVQSLGSIEIYLQNLAQGLQELPS